MIPGWISQTGLGPLIGRPYSLRLYSRGSGQWVSGDSNFRFLFRSSMSLTWGFFRCLFGSVGQSDHLQVATSWSQLVSFRHSTMFSPSRDALTTAEDLSQSSQGDLVCWPVEEDAVGKMGSVCLDVELAAVWPRQTDGDASECIGTPQQSTIHH